MELTELHILNYKNIHEADLCFHSKLNCFVGLNGQGKTNVLDAIYLLSFTKSAFNSQDSLNITHGEDLCLVKGTYLPDSSSLPLDTPSIPDSSSLVPPDTHVVSSDAHRVLIGCSSDAEQDLTITCGLRRGTKKQFRRGSKSYNRLTDHIGLIPLVMVSPEDGHLIDDGSDERRRFMDVVISQQNKTYLDHLTRYNALLKQRNALLKQETVQPDILEAYELQMIQPAEYIYHQRAAFIDAFTPVFRNMYEAISGGAEQVSLQYVSQLQTRDLTEALARTRQRDMILGWTSQGVHKDDIAMSLGDHPLKQVGSQGQQKTYLLAMKLAQAVYLGKPILLLDDIFDKLDSERVERIINLVLTDRFGQIFITDTDRQHLTQLLQHSQSKVFYVEKGTIHIV